MRRVRQARPGGARSPDRLAGRPAERLFLTYPTFRVASPSSGLQDYLRLSGTSMAAPVVTATVAAMQQVNLEMGYYGGAYAPRPALTPNTVKAILQFTTTDVKNDAGVSYDHRPRAPAPSNARGAIDVVRNINPAAPAALLAHRAGQRVVGLRRHRAAVDQGDGLEPEHRLGREHLHQSGGLRPEHRVG
ncbi:MAG: S8 family serine peptidase [Vicinamibacterales bacterium]